MKNKKFERCRHTAKAYAKKPRPRQLVRGIDTIYVYDRARAKTWCTDFGFRLGSQWVIVNWVHPYVAYASQLEDLAWAAFDALRPADPGCDSAFDATFEPIYEAVGRSRKKSTRSMRQPASEAALASRIGLDQELARLKSDITTLVVGPTLRVEQTARFRRVDLCFPVDLTSENDIVEFAHLVRRHLRREIDLLATVNGYRYAAADYANDQQTVQTEQGLTT